MFGAEADGSWRELIDDRFGVFGDNTTLGNPMGSVANDTTYSRSEQGALGTLRGRVGYAWNTLLVYATGGLAVGRVEHQVVEILDPGVSCITPSAANAESGCRVGSASKTKFGWTVGAGFEVALDRRWSVGAEYLYVDLGETTITLAPLAGAVFFNNVSTSTFSDRSHIARVKLNYRWGTDGPIVARY